MPYDSYSIRLIIPCKPENVDKILQDTRQIISDIQEKGISESDLNKIKENYILNYNKRIKNHGLWLGYLINYSMHNADPKNILKFAENINSITAKEIQLAAQKYLKNQNSIVGILLPEKK